MEFSGQYLTYEEYRSLGGTLDLTPFNLLEYEARRRIDNKTQNRLVGGKDIPFEVRLCVFEIFGIVKKYQNENNQNNGNVASENIDGYSVTYKDIKKALEEKSDEVTDIIINYLYGVMYNGEHIIYCGV